MLRDVQRREQHAVISPLPPSRPYGDASDLQGTPDRAGRHVQTFRDPVGGATLAVELDSPVQLSSSKRSAVTLGDPVAPNVPEHRRAVHPERRRQLLDGDTPAVGSYQLSDPLRLSDPLKIETALDGQSANHRIGRVDRRLARGLAQHRPQWRQVKHRAIYLRKRVASGRRRSSRTVTR